MSYITLTNGDVIESEWDAEKVVACAITANNTGKPWMRLSDGGYYHVAHIVSVTDKKPGEGIDELMDELFRCGRSDAE